MLLRQVDGPFIRDAQVCGELADEEHRQVGIPVDEVRHDVQRNHADGGRFERRSICQVILVGEEGPVSEVLDRLDHADDLRSSAYAVFIDFDLPFQQAHHVFRFISLVINEAVPLKGADGRMLTKDVPFVLVQDAPDFCEAGREIDFFFSLLLNHGSKKLLVV